MGQVNIAHVDECQTGAFPELTGLTALGEIGSRGVYAKPDRPLWLWMHELASGAQIRFAQPPLAHLLYVWKGELAADGVSVGAEGVVCVEHLGTTTVTAGQSGATLLHYHSQGPDPTREARPGGGVHVLGCDGIRKVRDDTYYETTTTVWTDAACPRCELWFHQSKFEKAYPQGHPHYHTEDEIIFVVQGGLVFGRRVLKPGSALAVDKGTVYGFGVDEGGLAFTNFRPSEPHFVMMSRDGPKHAPFSERDHLNRGTPFVRQP